MRVAKWGNSLAVRIPKTVADAAKLRQGDELELVPAGRGKVEVRAIHSQPTLAQLVKQITPENRHGETDWGRPVGSELW